MAEPAQPTAKTGSLLGDSADEVSPLELFFDLVFVFAVSQLSDHLLHAVTWRGAGETTVLLVAVFAIWSLTSWSVTFPQGGRAETPSIFAVLFLALFANAAIPRAFSGDPWPLVVPFLVCLLGEAVLGRVTAGPGWLAQHSRAMLLWIVAESALWLAGTFADPSWRLAWWAAAAVVNVAGGWLAHPVPGHRFRSGRVPFRPARIIERSRLLLLIALGECVLEIGTSIGGTDFGALHVVAALVALGGTTALWFLYFRGAAAVVDETASASTDRLRVARIALNSQLVVLAGLILIAVGDERAVEDPAARASLGDALLLDGGALLYVAAQTWYVISLTKRVPRAGIVCLVTLVLAPAASVLLPRAGALALATTLVVALVAAAQVWGQRAHAKHG